MDIYYCPMHVSVAYGQSGFLKITMHEQIYKIVTKDLIVYEFNYIQIFQQYHRFPNQIENVDLEIEIQCKNVAYQMNLNANNINNLTNQTKHSFVLRLRFF